MNRRKHTRENPGTPKKRLQSRAPGGPRSFLTRGLRRRPHGARPSDRPPPPRGNRTHRRTPRSVRVGGRFSFFRVVSAKRSHNIWRGPENSPVVGRPALDWRESEFNPSLTWAVALFSRDFPFRKAPTFHAFARAPAPSLPIDTPFVALCESAEVQKDSRWCKSASRSGLMQ